MNQLLRNLVWLVCRTRNIMKNVVKLNRELIGLKVSMKCWTNAMFYAVGWVSILGLM